MEGADAQSTRVYVPSDSMSILSCTCITLKVLLVQTDVHSLFKSHLKILILETAVLSLCLSFRIYKTENVSVSQEFREA